MTENDACELLGLQSGASSEAVKEAYRRMSKKVHPDQGGSAALFRQVQEAYELLTNKGSSAAQDTARAAEAQKAAAEKQRKETERKQREENERRREAERRQREEAERRKRAESSGPPADLEMVELMTLEIIEMREGCTDPNHGYSSEELGLSPDQIQHLLSQIEPMERMLESVAVGQRFMSEVERESMDAKLQVLKKPYDEAVASLSKKREGMSAQSSKPKKKKFGFF